MHQAGIPTDRCVAGGEIVVVARRSLTVLPSQHSCVWSEADNRR
jgi:hypothetical protein